MRIVRNCIFLTIFALSGCYMTVATGRLGREHLAIIPEKLELYRDGELLYFYTPSDGTSTSILVDTTCVCDLSKISHRTFLESDRFFKRKFYDLKIEGCPIYAGRPKDHVLNKSKQVPVSILNRMTFEQQCPKNVNLEKCYSSYINGRLSQDPQISQLLVFDAPPYKGAILRLMNGSNARYLIGTYPMISRSINSGLGNAVGKALVPLAVLGDIVLLPIGVYRFATDETKLH